MQSDMMRYWDTQRKGANAFNKVQTAEWFTSAEKANIRLIRLAFAKWKGVDRDFLIGNADHYTGIPEADFQHLKKHLDTAHQKGLKVVPTPLSLPGARWIQNSPDKKRDGRLWQDFGYQKQAIQYWTDLATRLKGHPAIAAYGILNEPHPELSYGMPDAKKGAFTAWYTSRKNTPADLNRFYRQMVAAIRKVDPETPIVLESGHYASALAFEYLAPLDDPEILYSFHMYEPWALTTYRINSGKYAYPGKFPLGGSTFELSRAGLKDFLNPVLNWQEKHQIPSSRIWAGEFGCDRQIKGVERYLGDLIQIFNAQNWHWSFYSYREDVWASMDYELGTGKIPYQYWEWQEAGELHRHYETLYTKTASNPIWNILKKEFTK